MSTTIAIVLNVSGKAWAEASDGSRRLLEEGSALMAGERLITADDARVQLDFGYNSSAIVDSGMSILATAEMAGNFTPALADTGLEDDSVAQALASIEEALGGSIEDAEAPAAGLEGGSSGGSSSVRLARIIESIDPAGFGLELTAYDPDSQFLDEIDGSDEEGDRVAPPDDAIALPGNISIDSVSGGSADAPTYTVNGSSNNLLPSSSVQVTITDQDGNTLSQQIAIAPDGSFTGVFSPLAGLVDGPITVEATGTGSDQVAVSDSSQGSLDLTAGALQVDITETNYSEQTISLTGTTSDVAPGESVSITIADAEGTQITVTTTVAVDGSYSVTGADISGLVDGTLTIEASATDRNGNAVSDSASGTLDALAGDLAVAIDAVNDAAQTIDLSGSTTDVAPGESVTITITDAGGTQVTATAIVGSDGSYSVTDTDISGLVDGTLTVDASATDRNGSSVSDTANGTLDAAAAGLTVSVDTVNNGAQTIDLSGTTTDVAPGESIGITITDADNNVVTTTATVASDGSYSVTGADVSGLVDGTLTIEASATDRNGSAVSDTASGILDALAGDLSVAIDAINDAAQTIDLSGSTSDVAPGESVTITITDANGSEVTTTATVTADGSYSVIGADISNLVDGTLTVVASATDRNDNAVSDTATGSLDALAGSLTVTVDTLDNTAQTADLSGTTTDVAPGESVSISITDANGTQVTATATVGSDGSYSVTGADVSGLVDGTLTVTAEATDRNGNAVSDAASGTLDALAGDLSVAIDAINDAAQTIDLSGSTTDVAPGESVSITITDVDGTQVTATAIVGSDGSYSVTDTDISGLVDGTLTVDASATDRNGSSVSDTANGTLDAAAAGLTVSVDTINDGAQTIDLSGTTTDVAPGESISITITDADKNVVTTTATVASDGSYSVTGADVSGLVDGTLTIEASAADRNGNIVSGTASGTLDATAGNLTLVVDEVDDTAQTLDLSGTTNDVAANTVVSISITDAAGTVVNTTATVDANGVYDLAGVDISTLVDGTLTVTAEAADRNGNAVSDTATGSLDALAGSLTVTVDTLDNTAQTADLSGTTTDVAPGESVSISITDANGTQVTATATVGSDGSYSVTGADVSGLVDGTLTVTAEATDRNGNAVSDAASGTLDALAGDLSVAIDAINDAAQTIDLSGSTTDVAPGESVSITITDADGTQTTTTATVATDGSYSVTGADISGLVDGTLTIEASATDRNGNAVSDTASGTLDVITGDLTVAIDAVDNSAQTVDLSGATNDLKPGDSVTITITDADNNEVTTTATVAADGSYSVTGADISSLIDGTLTVTAEATDRNGNAVSDTATGTLDALAGDLSIAIDAINDAAQTIDLSGSTTDVAPGESVSITITDVDGTQATTTATVAGDGSYSVIGADISNLVDGALTVEADATDRNGNAVSDTATGSLDALAGSLTVTVDTLDNTAQTADLSGTTTDVAPGESVSITITDVDGTQVTTTATVAGDGSYSVIGADISNLVDGALTVEADATDRNGNAVSDTATGSLDALAGSLTVTVDTLDNTAQTADLSGTTTDVAPGESVSITITDANGTQVTATATVGSDGSYSVTGADVSSLIDGTLTVAAEATDRNGNAVSDTASGKLDALAGDLSVAIDAINDAAQTIDLSGSTTDVAPGESVNITITDVDGTQATTTATVAADGSYSVTGADVSGLVDGTLTVTAEATDRNGNAVSDTATGSLDALTGDLSIAIDAINDAAQTLDLSGTTADVAPGESISITITDVDGTQATTTATVAGDGSYTVTGTDISSLVDGTITVDASATDRNGGAVSDTATGTLDAAAGTLTVSVDAVDDTAQTLDLSGTTTDVAPGESISITITDADNNVVTTTANVVSDGSYSVTGADISSLIDGTLTVTAEATDRNGNAVSDTASGKLDALAGDLSVAIDAINDAAQTIDLSGSTTDVAPGESVSISITDANGTQVTATATVGSDGSYSVTGADVSGLVDGTLTVTAEATDRNGNAASDTASATLDALAGDLSVAIDAINDAAQTIDLSGSASDVAPGEPISITITDADNNEVNTTATVAGDGSYSVIGVDISSLVDGTITVDASATDRNGDSVSDTASGTLDATAGTLTVSVDAVDDTAQTLDLSGTTTDVAPGEPISITITDADGTQTTTTATVATDGSYSVTGADISGLVDGNLTVAASASDRNGNTVSDTANGTLDAMAGNLTVVVDGIDSTAQTLDLSGTTADVTPGESVTITITDANGSEVTTPATVTADGSYSVIGADISNLVDGTLTVVASATDRNGNAVSDTATGSLDALAGSLAVTVDTLDNTAQTADLSGTTTDVAPGESVSITITDVDGTQVTTTATVAGDGSYSVIGVDISSLVDGAITVDASATDRNGGSVSDTASGTLDATPGSLTLVVDEVDDTAQTLDLSGTTNDVTANTVVSISITDAAGTVVNTTATVDANGVYDLAGVDISTLVDGTLTVTAEAADRNGNAVSDTATGSLDALTGDLSIAIDALNDAAQTIDLSGSTNDVAPGESVSITITDVDGIQATTTATVAGDGSYSVIGVDISSLVDGAITVDASATDRNGGAVSDTATGTLDAAAGTLTVSVDAVDDTAQTLDLSGTTTDVAPGEPISITITDADNNEVNTTATVAADGSYSVTGADVSGLVDGTLTIEASATDRNGNAVSDAASGTLDVITGDLTVAIDAVDNSAQTVDLSGATNDVKPGDTVTVTITDADNNEVNTTATVAADGSYSVTGADISGLVDGNLTVAASATDRNGNTVSDTANGTLDAMAGNLTVVVDGIDSTAQTLDVSGTTADVAPGESVSITITDVDGTQVTTTATVADDGSYSVIGADISSLVDGTITVDASATDRNGGAVSGTASGTLDATAGTLTVSVDAVDDTAQTLDLSGTTVDVAPGESISITITDADNNVVTTTATVASDGSYAVTGADVSGLVDGTLTVTAEATDRNGNAVSDTASGKLDALAGDLSVAIEAVDNNAQTINLSGTTTDVVEGSSITLTITDVGGISTSVTALVGADGSYSLSGIDTSGLADGAITVVASGTDRNGQNLSDSTTGTLDTNTAPEAGDDSYDTNSIQGLFGEYFAYEVGPDGSNLSNLAQVDAFIASTSADSTFIGTSVNYDIGTQGGNLGGEGKIQTFLKVDAGSLSSDPVNSSDAIIRMSGEMDLAPGTYQFRVRADDGYRILVNGDTVAVANKNQSPTTNTGSEFTLTGEGPHTVEIVYWDQGGQAVLGVEIRPQGGTYETFGSQHVSHSGIDSGLIVNENQALTIDPSTLLDNDIDANGDPLAIQSVQNPMNGEVSLDTNGNIIFTPDGFFTGEATFEYTVSDGRGATDTATVTVNVLPAADTPTLSVSDTSAVQAGATIISTGSEDLIVNPGDYNSGSGVNLGALERELGVESGYLNGRFDPTGSNVNHQGFVNVIDGKVSETTQTLNAGMEISWDYTFVNGEDNRGEVRAGFNDVVALVVTAPSGAKETLLVDSSENKFPVQSVTGSFDYTASESGAYRFQWLVLNGGDTLKDSSLVLGAPSLTVPDLSGSFGAVVPLDINAALADQDGSESLSILIGGMPTGAALTAGTQNADGTWSLGANELGNLQLLTEAGFSGDINLNITATATETATGDQESVTESMTVTVAQTDTTLSGTGGEDNLQGSAANDLIRGYDGDDLLDGGAGNDYLVGGAGNDVLIGGSGGDVLTGGVGADVFRWELGDESDSGIARDVVTDFTIDLQDGYSGAGQGDQLELSDLLQDASANTVTDYLMAKEENGDTVLYLNKDGALGDNTDNAQQSITLSGITMDGQSSEQFIDSMLNNGHIKIE